MSKQYMPREQWQIEQGERCGCKGSDEMCPCQNVSPEQKRQAILLEPDYLLDWMTYHHLPLELFREEETGLWVVVDASCGVVKGSGESCLDALVEARSKETS